MKKFLLGILVGFVLVGLTALVSFFVMLRLASRPPQIPDPAVLVLRVTGDIPERAPVEIPLPWFEGTKLTVRDYWELLRKAAADRRIRAVLLLPEDLRAGWGKLDELRTQIENFRRSGKPVYAFLRAPRTRDYYLATAADRVTIAPEDALDLKGMRVELMYLKGTLDKIGVDVEFEHAGKYKDAPEMFTRTAPSPASLESMNSILDAMYDHLTTVIGRARKKTPEQVRAIIDMGPFLSPQAWTAGLVDALEYQDQAFSNLKSRLKLGEIRRVSQVDYLKVPLESAGLRRRATIAVVAAAGTIVRNSEDGFFGDDELLAASSIRETLRRVAEDRNVRGVIFRIDSPGGDSFASDEIWHEVGLLDKKKPVVISMSDVAASGGYYIAMSGDPVLSYPGTITGSIGVFYGKANLHGLYDKLGIRKSLLTRGRFADIDSDYTPLNDAARQKLSGFVQATYDAFLGRVAHARKRSRTDIDAVAQGRVWLGSQAMQNGLVDELGGLDRAIQLLKQRARISPTEEVELVSYPPRRSILDALFARRGNVAIDVPILAPLRTISTLQWARGSTFYLMPFALEVR